MTREEAREILTHNWTRVDNPNYSESELDEAFFMAIEALSVKPQTDLISRADAIEAVYKIMPIEYRIITDKTMQLCDREEFVSSLMALPAETVSREEYEETDGVVTIEKQNANEVGEIKHIVIRSPNYTRYFYNESMPLPSADAVEVVRCKNCYYAEDDITHMYCVYFGHKVYGDDYCSNAVERREESEDKE